MRESRSVRSRAGGMFALAASALATLLATSVALRLEHDTARDRVRHFNKRFLNPAMMKVAGRRHWYAGVIRHQGRRSAKEYATPVVAVPVSGDAFVIPLPYGEGVDWLKNVLASGEAVIEVKGESYDVAEPEVIGAEEAFVLLDERHRRTWRRFGIERFLRVKRLHHDEAATHWEVLRGFRATHLTRHLTVAGVEWEYIVGGEGEDVLLILGGGFSTDESAFRTILRLEGKHRIISPSYPAVGKMGELCDGLVAILDAEGVGRVHVFGHSLGAAAAHVLARRHPERVDRLILSGFGLYTPLHTRVVKLFAGLPYPVLRAYYRRAVTRLLSGTDEGERAFLGAYVEELFSAPNARERLRSMLDLLVDTFDHADGYAVRTPVEKPDGVLILASRDDRGFAPSEREALVASYPGARVRIFESGGHWAGTTRRGEYDAAVDDLLEGGADHGPRRPAGQRDAE